MSHILPPLIVPSPAPLHFQRFQMPHHLVHNHFAILPRSQFDMTCNLLTLTNLPPISICLFITITPICSTSPQGAIQFPRVVGVLFSVEAVGSVEETGTGFGGEIGFVLGAGDAVG